MHDEGFRFLTSGGDNEISFARSQGRHLLRDGTGSCRAAEDVSNSFTWVVNNWAEERSERAGQACRAIPLRDMAFQLDRRTVSPKNRLNAFVDVMH